MFLIGVINEQFNKLIKFFVEFLTSEKIKSRIGAFLGIFDFVIFAGTIVPGSDVVLQNFKLCIYQKL